MASNCSEGPITHTQWEKINYSIFIRVLLGSKVSFGILASFQLTFVKIKYIFEHVGGFLLALTGYGIITDLHWNIL